MESYIRKQRQARVPTLTQMVFMLGFAIGIAPWIAAGQDSASDGQAAASGKDHGSKVKTLAAWKAMQKVGYDSEGSPPKGRLDDPASLKPTIWYFRAKAAAFSQIDLENVDSTLTDHLGHRIAVYTRFADLLQKEYNDIVGVMQSMQRDAKMRRIFADLVTETDEEKGATNGG